MAYYKRTEENYSRETQSRPRKWAPLDVSVKDFDFKDFKFISKYITERGKILPRRITGLNAQLQRRITKAIKRARQLGLLPYISYGS